MEPRFFLSAHVRRAMIDKNKANNSAAPHFTSCQHSTEKVLKARYISKSIE